MFFAIVNTLKIFSNILSVLGLLAVTAGVRHYNASYQKVYACACFVLNKYVLHISGGWADCPVHSLRLLYSNKVVDVTIPNLVDFLGGVGSHTPPGMAHTHIYIYVCLYFIYELQMHICKA